MNRLIRPFLMVAALVPGSPALAGQQTVKLSVPGMDCSACPAIVEGSLQKVMGVTRVKVSLEQKTAVVTFDDAKASVADLVKATTNAGYPSRQVPAAAQ